MYLHRYSTLNTRKLKFKWGEFKPGANLKQNPEYRKYFEMNKRSPKTETYFVRGISEWLTSLTGLDSSTFLMLNQQQIYLFGQTQISQAGGQPYGDTSLYKVSECSQPKKLPTKWSCLGFPQKIWCLVFCR